MPSFTLRFSTSTSTSMPTSAYRLASSSSSGATIGRRAASSSIAVTLSTSSTANSNPNSRGVNLHSLSRPRAIQCRTLFLGVQHIPILASVDNSNSNTNTSTSSSGNSSSGSVSNTASISASTAGSSSGLRTRSWTPSRGLAQVRTEGFSELWFTASFPVNDKSGRDEGKGLLRTSSDGIEQGQGPGSGKDHKSPDERTLKLGRTLRILSPLLPNILTTNLPQEILSPSISLHLFPSTHPHLPVVKGRVPFRAALWTAPVAWGSVPIVGNVKLEIVSEKIVRTGFVSAPINGDTATGEEKLVVRWKTEKRKNGDTLNNSKTEGNNTSSSGSSSATSTSTATGENGAINRGLSTLLGGSQPIFKSNSDGEPFTGLFIFSFDEEGRIASQTIEHANEDQGYDKTSRVVTLTDWLLGKARWGVAGRLEEQQQLGGLVPGFAMKRLDVRMDECRVHAGVGSGMRERREQRSWDFKD